MHGNQNKRSSPASIILQEEQAALAAKALEELAELLDPAELGAPLQPSKAVLAVLAELGSFLICRLQ